VIHGIVENHDGIITVDSEMGRGTTFDIYLPASEDAVETAQPQKVDSRKSPGPLLFVDDDEDLVAIARRMLKQLFGYEVFTAKNGNEAIEIYSRKANEIALVILDLIMPEMGGGETFDRLRELNPKVKVLLSSGYSLEGEAAEIMARGCDGFIQKPFDLDELSGKILEVLDRK
ncbi:MAG: response regulator, partial [bacterium]